MFNVNPDSLSFSAAVIAASFAASMILTALVRQILLRRAMLDIPNERSSHSAPVPRGGGWAIVAVMLPGLAGASFVFDHDIRQVPLIIGIMLLAGISWLDDRKGMGAAQRLSLHLIAACLGSLAFMPDQLLLGGAVPFWLDRTVMIIGWAWFINLYNFMDGIDGITGVETVSVATGTCLVMTAAGIVDPVVSCATLLLTGACLGFLAHNWHPAKIFLGDIGSVPLGYIVAFCLITLAVHGHLIPALILPLYYLADSGITIVKRAVRGEKIWQAHRQHFYQQATRGVGRHDIVALMIAVANIGLVVAAIAAVSAPWAGGVAGVVIVAVLLKKMHKVASLTRGIP
ncbi:MAG: glycosyltransferase family 4 protein [Alphaproteobacteria bacterium]|nr:glycosyltransferase family 4 protein [Alphaproteobacteria bacterium]